MFLALPPPIGLIFLITFKRGGEMKEQTDAREPVKTREKMPAENGTEIPDSGWIGFCGVIALALFLFLLFGFVTCAVGGKPP